MHNDEKAVLRQMLEEIRQVRQDTHKSRAELAAIDQDLESIYALGKVPQFRYDLEKENLRRSSESINYCLRRLDFQRKVALETLRKLEADD